MKKAFRMLFLIAWSSVLLPVLVAQQPGVVRGAVEDPSGAPVAAASVKLTAKAAGTELKTVTDEKGHFVFPEVPPGEYVLRVKMEGFQKAEVPVEVGATPTPPQRVRLAVPDTMSETDFICAITYRTGCGLLLDVNNVFVSAANHGYAALDYLSDFPLAEVGEIHLAGHAEQSDDEGERLLIDSHDGPVADAVWKLYEIVISRWGPIPTLIEWDSKIPAWPVLRAEAAAARAILDRFISARAVGGGHAA